MAKSWVWLMGAAISAALVVGSAKAGEPKSAIVYSPIRGKLHLAFDDGAKRIEERQTVRGHQYRWVIQDSAFSALLQGADGANCPRYRQFVRATPRRLVFGWRNRRGDLVGLRWLASACLDGGASCRLHVVKN